MIRALHPLDVTVTFEDRPYRLGEAIDVAVDITARNDVEIRQGRVDLVCRERMLGVHTLMVPASRPLPVTWMTSMKGVDPAYSHIRIPKRITKEYKLSYSHSGVVLLDRIRLRTGERQTYHTSLEITPMLPYYARQGGTSRWTLETAMDLVWALNSRVRHPVMVDLEGIGSVGLGHEIDPHLC